MTTRICLVRHGETAWNAEHRVQGQTDVPLNALGEAQARAAALALASERFDALYSSDLLRARQTAQPLAERQRMEILLEAGLRERHYGIFETLTYAEVKVKYPEDYARFDAREPGYDFRTGESLQDFSRRCIDAFERIAGRHPGQSVLVFTHGGVLDKLYRYVNGLPIDTPRDFGIPNAGLNRVQRSGAGWRVLGWADTAHLDGALDDLPQ